MAINPHMKFSYKTIWFNEQCFYFEQVNLQCYEYWFLWRSQPKVLRLAYLFTDTLRLVKLNFDLFYYLQENSSLQTMILTLNSNFVFLKPKIDKINKTNMRT